MKSSKDTIRFSVSLPASLLNELDKRFTAQGYASRSELVRDMIRSQLIDDAWIDDTQDVVGVLTICYDHHQRELAQRIIDTQHSQLVNILCSTHVHLDHAHCLETIIIKGRPPEIELIAIEIGGMRGVVFAELTRAASAGL